MYTAAIAGLNLLQVLRGEMTEEQVLLEFLDTLGDATTHGNRDGKISLSEFMWVARYTQLLASALC